MVRHPLLAIVVLLAAPVLASCSHAQRAPNLKTNSRPIAKASADHSRFIIKPIQLGAGDTLGRAVFAQYAAAEQSAPTRLAVRANTPVALAGR